MVSGQSSVKSSISIGPALVVILTVVGMDQAGDKRSNSVTDVRRITTVECPSLVMCRCREHTRISPCPLNVE